MNPRLRTSLLTAGALIAPLLLGGLAAPAATAGPEVTGARGRVIAHAPLPKRLWIPRTTRRAYRITYVTSDTFGRRALSTGEVFLPRGRTPRGGWPVISWAHGTSGLADKCAPSRVGPAEPARDFAYLRTWMRQGYAIVASDYTGLGTPGLHAYLDGRTEAHNIVDMVKAGRNFTRRHLGSWARLSRKWVTIGQSQGGGASIYTARYATEFGGPGLDYRGAVGTGTPANIEKVLLLLGPKLPPVPVLPEGITSYIAYILASLEYAHPELGIDTALTDEGRHWVARARRACVIDFEEELKGVNLGDWFTRPLALLPNFAATVKDYMAMPESGFDKPFFMANGLIDTDVPMAVTAAYVLVLTLNREPVEFHTYPTDHNGTMAASLPDSVPFVAARFAG